MLLLLLACSDGATPKDTSDGTGTGDSSTTAECTEDTECGDGRICDAGTCVDGDRNNSADEAQAITEDVAGTGVIWPAGDADWYAFPSDGREFIRAETVLGSDAGETQDTWLTLYDPDGNLVATVDDYPTGGHVNGADAVLYAWLPDAGTYTLKVEDATAHEGGTPVADLGYVYTVTEEGWGYHTEDPDSVDDPGETIAPTTSNSWTAVGVLIDEAGDVDTVSLDFPVDASPLTVAGAVDLGNSAAVPVVELQQDGDVLSHLDDVGAGGSLGYPSLQSGNYQLVLSDGSGAGGDDHWFFVYVLFDDEGSAYPEETEPDDDADAANLPSFAEKTSSSGSPYSYAHIWGHGDGAGDEDWYRIDAPYDETYVIVCAQAATYGATSSPTLELYDSGGSMLASSTDWGSPPDARIEDVTTSETTWLRVVNGGGSTSDWYEAIVYAASFSTSSYEDGGYSCP